MSKPAFAAPVAIALVAAATLSALPTSPALAQEPVVLRTGAFAPAGSVFATYWARFKTNVERDSKGTIKVDLNMGDPNEGNLLSNLRRGRVDCVGASLQGSATILPEVAVLQLPYLFASFRHVDHAYDAGLVESYRKLFDAKGIAMLSFVEVGFTHTYATMPVKAPADVKGVKMRATLSRASQAWIKATGAEPVVLPIAEAVPGLQTGLIKGGESGLGVYSGLSAKAAPQYTLTAHAFDSGTVMCNKDFFAKLTPEQQQAVRNGWNAKDQARDTRAANEKFLADAAGMGITVHRPSAAEQAQWQAAGKKAADELIAAFTPEAKRIYDEIQKDLATLK
jgi:TRAP-type C4-dicarboxylate transport system substrate-binding protein